MGKQKRQRKRPHKENPTGLLSVKDFDETEDTANGERERTLLNVYDGMQSVNMEEQLSALQTLETMAWDVSMADYIAKDGIVKTVGPLLLHSNATIRAAAASTLKQFAKSSANICATLIKDDIMTPLSALLKQYYSNWIYKNDKNATDEQETYISALNLLWILSENDENIIKYINEQNLVSILTKYMDNNSYGIDIVTTTMQCLLIIAEDNVDAITQIKSNVGILHDIIKTELTENTNSKQSEIWVLKISSFALLSNICSNDMYMPSYVNIFTRTLDELFNVDNKQLLSSLVSILPHENNISSSKRKKIMESEMVLFTQRLALEILTNLFSNDNDEDDESADIDDSEEIDPDSNPMDVDNANEDLKRSFPVELVEAFNHCNLIGKIWEKTVAVDADSQEILDQVAEGKAMLCGFHALRCKAYLCLNNLLPNFDIDTLGGIDYLYSKWLEIGKFMVENINGQSIKRDIELLDAAIFVMRAIIDRLTCIQVNVFTQLNEADFQLILNNEIQTRNTNESIRVNMMRILGTLTLNLTRSENQQAYTMAKQICEIMLDSCMGETQMWVLAETIDAIMDLFAEDQTDYLAFDVQLIQRLRPLVPGFKDKVRQQKGKLKDSIAVVSTVNTNIWRFIKYKEKRIRRFM